MSKIDEIISSIPDNKMSEGYQKQKEGLLDQLALNASAYRLQEANKRITDDQKKQLLSEIGESLIMIQEQLNEIDRRLNSSSEALKG